MGANTRPTKLTRLSITDADGLRVGDKIVPQTFFLTKNVAAGAAVADFDGVLPVPVAAKLISVTMRYQTASSAAETLMVKKVPSGTAKAAGTNCLAAGMALNGTPDTNISPALHATAANYTFAAGDGIGEVASGAPTLLDGVGITYQFQRV